MTDYTFAVPVLTVPEAAAMLGVSKEACYSEIRRTDKLAGVRVIRVGRCVRVSREMLERSIRGELTERAA